MSMPQAKDADGSEVFCLESDQISNMPVANDDTISEPVPAERCAVEETLRCTVAQSSGLDNLLLTKRADQMDDAIARIIARLDDFEQRLKGVESHSLHYDNEVRSIQSSLKELYTGLSDGTFVSSPGVQEARAPNASLSSDVSHPHLRLQELQNALDLSQKLENSLWDAVIVACFDALAWHESALIMFLCLLAFLVESAFVIILVSHESEAEFSQEMASDMRDWRVLFAHDSNHANVITGESLASMVCHRSSTLLVGESQAMIYSSLYDYGIREEGSSSRQWPALPVGSWLALIALFAWSATVVKELRSTLAFANAVLCMPRGHSARLCVNDSGSISVVESSRLHVCLLLGFIALPRLIIAVILGMAGANFLAVTPSISDLILNAMALEVVLQIDELLFEALLPYRVNHVIETFDPIPIQRSAWGIWWRSWGISLSATSFVFASLIIVYLVVLGPMVQDMQDTADAMCSGNIEFAFFKDAFGYVYFEPAPTSGKSTELSQSYAYRAVLQSTDLEPSRNPRLAIEVGHGKVSDLSFIKDLSFQGLADIWPVCKDFDDSSFEQVHQIFNRFAAGVQLAREAFSSASIHNCSDVLHFCHDLSDGFSKAWTARSHCPVTCGCDDISKTGFLASLPLTGCPSVCMLRHMESLADIKTCEDLPGGSPELQTYLKSLASYLTSWASGSLRGTELSNEDMLEQGCAIFAEKPLNRYCGDTEELAKEGLQGAHPFCPTTCHCRENFTRYCPHVCQE